MIIRLWLQGYTLYQLLHSETASSMVQCEEYSGLLTLVRRIGTALGRSWRHDGLVAMVAHDVGVVLVKLVGDSWLGIVDVDPLNRA